MRESGANPSDIAFEITETALMQAIEAGESFARGLTEIGSNSRSMISARALGASRI